MKTEFKMALMVWRDSLQDLQIKKIEIYESPIKSGEYFLKLIQSTQISFGEEPMKIHCERKFYTVGQNDHVNSKVDLHRLEATIRSMTEECEERIAGALETLITQKEKGQPPKELDDF